MSHQTAIQTTNRNHIQRPTPGPQTNPWSYRPDIDVLEHSKGFTIVLDAPGVEPQSIDVTLQDQTLSVRGPVSPRYADNVKFLCQEYGVGDYYREIPLGNAAEQIDADRIAAKYENGVLTLEVPKHPDAAPRRIEVKAA